MQLPIQLFAFIGSLVSFSFLLAILINYYYQYKKAHNSQEIQASEPNTTVLPEANTKADMLVEKASEKALRIIVDAEYIKQNLTKELEEAMRTEAKKTIERFEFHTKGLEAEFKKLLDEIKTSFSQKSQITLKDIEKIGLEELEDFRNILKEETVNSQKVIGNKISEEFKKAQVEIEEYKKERLQKTEDSIQKIVLKVVENVLGKVIPLEEHEKLIIQALETAKKEGLFSS